MVSVRRDGRKTRPLREKLQLCYNFLTDRLQLGFIMKSEGKPAARGQRRRGNGMNTIRTDLKRAIFGKTFLLASLGMLLCLLFASFSELYDVYFSEYPYRATGYHEQILVKAMGSDILLLVTPILAAIPYTSAFVDDEKSGYIKSFLPRTSVTRYVLGKELGCALSGGLALVCGIGMAYVVLGLLLLPHEVLVDYVVESKLGEIAFKALLFFLQGACWSLVGMLLSALSGNIYLAYAAPFILYYVLIILQERYFRTTFMLNPKNYLTLEGAWPLGGKSAFLMIAIILVILLLAFYALTENKLRGGEAEHRFRQLIKPRPIEKRIARARRATGRVSPLHKVLSVAGYNFRMWRGNMRIVLTFALAFILCFLLSDKAASFAYDMNTAMQAFEPFVWTFGDANSVLLISLLLVLLFADIPFLGAGVPYYLVRMKRSTWAWGQLLYIIAATAIYMVFIFAATSIICAQNSFLGNMWSETAAILGYSGAGRAVALPALVKTLEMSRPYRCALLIFLLMLAYTLTLVLLMLYFKLKFGKGAGVAAAFGFSLYGFLLNPQLFKQLMHLPDELMYKANVLTGWLSPLNHATYHMHNFGYDLLPRLWQTFAIFGALILGLMILILRAIKSYNFMFLGGDNQ